MVGQNIEVSVVAPVFNEEDNVVPLYDQITQTLDGKYSYEIIFIDDGSDDKSFPRMKELHKSDSRFKVIRFRRNFGQTAALSAGFQHARGKIIIAIDADLQNDPADIPAMIKKLEDGYDVVSGWRKKRHDKALTRRIPSKIANWLISRITGVKLHDFGCTLKAYRRELITETKLYGEMHRFIPALASWRGARICEMVVNHRPRMAGIAKYGLGLFLDETYLYLRWPWNAKHNWCGSLRIDYALSEICLKTASFNEQESSSGPNSIIDYRHNTIHSNGAISRVTR
jgi:glycosyltransferase involved in cell wall biosynthesis